MEQWSIRNNVVNCVQYDRNPRDFYNIDVKVIDQKIYVRLKEDRQIIEVDFGDILDKLKGDFLDMYDVVKSEVLGTICLMRIQA